MNTVNVKLKFIHYSALTWSNSADSRNLLGSKLGSMPTLLTGEEEDPVSKQERKSEPLGEI